MKLDVKTLDAKKAGSVELDDGIFGLEPRADILHRMVRYQLLKRQAGTHKAKGRSEVSGTGAKMYRQKGTGRARHGDKKAPQFRGGGKAFGPQPRSHAIDLPKKIRALAMRHALSSKARAQTLMVLESAEVDAPKTRDLNAKLEKLGLANALIVSGQDVQESFAKAARNIPNIDVLPVQGLNVYDILRRDNLVLTKDAIAALEARFK
jgi:large subunit ribosomal protein L4